MEFPLNIFLSNTHEIADCIYGGNLIFLIPTILDMHDCSETFWIMNVVFMVITIMCIIGDSIILSRTTILPGTKPWCIITYVVDWVCLPLHTSYCPLCLQHQLCRESPLKLGTHLVSVHKNALKKVWTISVQEGQFAFPSKLRREIGKSFLCKEEASKLAQAAAVEVSARLFAILEMGLGSAH